MNMGQFDEWDFLAWNHLLKGVRRNSFLLQYKDQPEEYLLKCLYVRRRPLSTQLIQHHGLLVDVRK